MIYYLSDTNSDPYSKNFIINSPRPTIFIYCKDTEAQK